MSRDSIELAVGLIIGAFLGSLIGSLLVANSYQRQAMHHGYGVIDANNQFQWKKGDQ